MNVKNNNILCSVSNVFFVLYSILFYARSRRLKESRLKESIQTFCSKKNLHFGFNLLHIFEKDLSRMQRNKMQLARRIWSPTWCTDLQLTKRTPAQISPTKSAKFVIPKPATYWCRTLNRNYHLPNALPPQRWKRKKKSNQATLLHNIIMLFTLLL